MLPFLKKRQEASTSAPVESVKREPDGEKPEFDMLDAICEDLKEAISKEDNSLLKATLQAFISHILDEIQNQSLTNKE